MQKNIYVRRLAKCTQKRKLENSKTLVFGCVCNSYALNLAHSVANKSSWVKVVQGHYFPFFNLNSKNDIYSLSLFTEQKHLLVKTKVKTIMQYYDKLAVCFEK